MDKEKLWSNISDLDAELTKGGFSDIIALVEGVTFTKGDTTVTIDEITILMGADSFTDCALGFSSDTLGHSMPTSREVPPLS